MMKKALFFLWLSLLMPLMASAQTHYIRHDIEPLREVQFSNGVSYPSFADIVFDGEGNFYVAGCFGHMGLQLDGTLICPSDTLAVGYTFGGNVGIYLAKYDSEGNQLWVKSARSTNGDFMEPCIAMSDGELYVSFSLWHEWTPDSKNIWLHYWDTTFFKEAFHSWTEYNFPFPCNAREISECHIARFDLDGNMLSDHCFSLYQPQQNTYAALVGCHLSVDGNRNAYLAAPFVYEDQLIVLQNRDTANLLYQPSQGPKARRSTHTSGIVKMDPSGNVLWARYHCDSISGRPSGQSMYIQDEIRAFFTDKQDNIYTLHDCSPIHCDTGERIWLDSVHYVEGVSEPFEYYYIVKRDSDGHVLWVQQPYYSEVESSLGVGVQSAGYMMLDNGRLYFSVRDAWNYYPAHHGDQPNCFLDPERQHPLLIQGTTTITSPIIRHGAVVEYDAQTGSYLHHDTIPAACSVWGANWADHPRYRITGVNMGPEPEGAGTFYCVYTDKQTGDIYYGNPQTYSSPLNSYLYRYYANGRGLLLRVLNNKLTFYYDPLLDTAYLPQPETHTLLAQADDPAMGSVSGSGSYAHGDTATLTATAYEGFHFLRWHDGLTDNPRTLIVLSDTTLTALFAQDTPDPNAISPVAPEQVLSVEYYDLLGRPRFGFHSSPADLPRGIYLERTVTTQGVSTRKVARMTNL